MVKTTKQGTTVTYELSDCRFIDALDILRGALRDSITDKSNLINTTM